MDIADIRSSGLLELYVLGECSAREHAEVEKALVAFPELQNDLYEIGAALELYAKQYQVPPGSGGKEALLKKAGATSPPSSATPSASSGAKMRQISWPFVAAAASAALFAFLYLSDRTNRLGLEGQFDDYRAQCDSLQQVADQQYAVLNLLQDPNNRVLNIQSTGNFENTDLILLYNEVTRQNFVQVRSLPVINDQQSFQLWSLKPGVDPVPLTVFQGDEGIFIPVSFEDDTQTYAITIEPFGGRPSPTLENLIGTVNVPA